MATSSDTQHGIRPVFSDLKKERRSFLERSGKDAGERPRYGYLIATLLLLVLATSYVDATLSLSVRPYLFAVVLGLGALQPAHRLIPLIALLIPYSQMLKPAGSDITAIPLLITVFIIKRLIAGRRIGRGFFILWSLSLGVSLINTNLRFGSLVIPLAFYVCMLFVHLARDLQMGTFVATGWASIIGILSSGLASFLFPDAALLVTAGISEEFTVRLGGLNQSWQFAQSNAVGLAFASALLIIRRAPLFVYLAIAASCVYFISLSGTYSVLIGVALVPFFIASHRAGSRASRFLSILTFGSLSLLVVYNFLFLPMVELRGQFSDNGRLDLWLTYVQLLKEDTWMLFFGVGADGIGAFSESQGILTSHNLLLETLVQFGIIGSVLLIAILFAMFRGSTASWFINPKVLPLYVFLTSLLTQGAAGSELLFLVLAMAYRSKEEAAISAAGSGNRHQELGTRSSGRSHSAIAQT